MQLINTCKLSLDVLEVEYRDSKCPNHRVEKPLLWSILVNLGVLSLMIFHVRVSRNAKTKGIGSVIVRGGSLWWNPRPGCGFSSTTSRQQEGARLAQCYKQSRIHQCLCLPCVLATSVSFPSPLYSCSSSFFFILNPPWSPFLIRKIFISFLLDINTLLVDKDLEK